MRQNTQIKPAWSSNDYFCKFAPILTDISAKLQCPENIYSCLKLALLEFAGAFCIELATFYILG